MKTEKNILIAFILNLGFSIFEFAGGAITSSTAIMSDAVHDLGDAVSIGISWFLERKSRKKPDEIYTYGYERYSVLGGVITTSILIAGSIFVIIEAVQKIIHPTTINYNGMIIFAVIGVIINTGAAWLTREGDSINQKGVNLHMLEDVLGWVVVLIGAIVMRFTNVAIIDPLMSIGVALFILWNAIANMKEVLDLFLDKVPKGISVEDLKNHVMHVEGVEDVHHIHIWSLDGQRNYATLHAVIREGADPAKIKEEIREEARELNIGHITVEIEQPGEACHSTECEVEPAVEGGHSNHHHHH